MSERASGPERYLRATRTSNLRLDLVAPSDADQLIAAGWCSQSPRRSLAMRVYRMRAAGSMLGARTLSEDLGEVLRSRMIRERRAGRDARYPTRGQASRMAMAVLTWWHMPACPVCSGRGHPTIPDTPNLDTSRECPSCGGTGIRPVERLVRTEYADDIRWLVSEMEALSGYVFDAMAQRLANRMEL